ncbi:MAG TPA: DapH/DapD/GlmU-related protein [Acidimicrobiales bacterium]|nr:DapH/DapD/GlmU-related protein [Acidimicrobiales bacterium]
MRRMGPQPRLHHADRAAASLLGRIERWRCASTRPMSWAYRLTDQQPVIDADVQRWASVLGLAHDDQALARLLYAFPEFRSIFYHRLQRGNPCGVLAGRLCKHLWKPVAGLDLAGTIGAGLFISHGQGTILAAERIGANCFVHHGVTVGWDYRSARSPIIGDDVFIGAGAKVLGAVTVGDGARIGANAVVVSDVPAGATAVGAPARVAQEALDPGELWQP